MTSLSAPVIKLINNFQPADIILCHQVPGGKIVVQGKDEIRQPDIARRQQSFIYRYQRFRVPDLLVDLVDQTVGGI
jgi:hypothetical protein